MSPCKPEPGIAFNSTECMAECAWRYGEAGLPYRDIGHGFLMFADGSVMGEAEVDTVQSWNCVLNEFPSLLCILDHLAMAMARGRA